MTSSRDFWPKFVIASRSAVRALDELADRVDLGPLQAVARPLGEVEVLDRLVEVGRAAGRGADVAELETLGVLGELGDEADEGAQRLARRGERRTRGDRAVGLDVEDQPVEVRRLLDPGRLDREGDAPHRREDGVDRDDADRRGVLVALGRDVALAPLDRDVHRQAALRVDRREVQLRVQHLDVRGRLQVGAGDVGRAAHVDAERHRARRTRRSSTRSFRFKMMSLTSSFTPCR